MIVVALVSLSLLFANHWLILVWQIIADLEQRLSRLDSGSDHKTAEVKHEIKTLQIELNDAKDANKKLEAQLATAREEVTFPIE